MLHTLFKRLWAGVVTLFWVVSLTFVLMRLLPGGPFDEARKVPPEIKANLEAQYHLQEPWVKQYGYYLGNLLHGDLGPSYQYKSRSVNNIIQEAAGTSFLLGILALGLGMSLGLLLGTLAGMTQSPLLDGALSLLGVSSISMPSFIFGGLLVLVFALDWHLLPVATLATPAHYVLPVITLSLVPFAYAFLLVRTAVKDTKTKAFVLMKKSMGISPLLLTLKHVLRNSLIPLVSILGPVSAAVVTGSFAVEYIFAIPGLGQHFITAVTNRDYTLVMGITLIYSVALIGFNIFTDILYGYLDPRFREVG